MATISWTGAAHDGLFNDALNWSSNPLLPGANDDVVIAPGTSTAITSPSGPTIHSISLNSNVTLTINSGTSFAASNGTNGAGISGTVDIANGAVLFIGGTVVNSGTINEQASGNTTEFQLTQNTTLTGGGHVTLSANASNFIFGQSGSFNLDNVNNIISGTGTIGDQQMVLTNAFVINANDAGATLVINPNGGTTNTGTLEATGGGTLDLNTQVTNSGGTIEATGAGSLLALQTTIVGGTITAASGGTVQSNDAALDGLPLHPVTNNTTIQVPNNEFLTLLGTIVNNGAINLETTANGTSARIGSLVSPMVTLQGTGAIHLGDNPNSELFGIQGDFQLINKSNTIDGAGQLGVNQVILVNQVAGVVNANQPNNGSPNGLLTIDTTGISVNQGLMEATSTGGLLIQNSLFNNAGGTLFASGATDFVRLQGANIEGGTLNTATGGVIETTSGDRSDVLDGLTAGAVNNKGTLDIADNSSLTFTGTVNNTGTIAVASAGNATQFIVGSPTVTLQGVGGQVVMSNNAANDIFGNAGPYRLVNVTNTISGAGEIGNGQTTMVLVNEALINANQPLALTLETAGDVVVNSGTLEGSGTGSLIISGTTVNNVVGSLTGTILASGAHVHLTGANIEGGNLVTTSGGVIDTTSGDRSSQLDGITTGTIANKGSVNIVDNSSLHLAGTINNTGTITLSSAGNSTTLIINSPTVTLQGAGQVILANNSANDILGAAAPFHFVNVNNTISGAGAIGNGNASMLLVNQGLINANQSLGLTLETAGDLVTNTGTMEATGAGGLLITGSTVNNVVGALAGTILASTGAHVNLQSAHVEGGNLVTASGGVIDTTGGDRNTVLDGLTTGVVNNEGSFDISDNSSATLWGTINNTGTISLTSGGSATQLLIGSAAVTLQGGGQLTMSSNTSNQILGNSNTFQFINVNNTISGSGVFGATSSPFYLINKALIDANQSVALTIQTAGDTIANTGTMEATGTGELLISGSTVNNIVGTLDGTIESNGAAAQVRLQGADIQGGNLLTPSGGVIATLGGDRSSVLDGLTTGAVNNQGSVEIADNSSLTLIGTIDNTGTIALTSAGSTTQLVLADQGATLTGNGQVVLGDNPGNQIVGNATTNTLVNNGNTITGAGQFGTNNMDFVNQAGTLQGTGSTPLTITLGAGIGTNKAGAWILAKGTGGVQFNSGIFANAGFIEALNSSVTFGPSAVNTNLIEGQLLGGNWRAISTGSGATIDMTGGAISTDAAVIIVSGANSTVQGGNGSSFTPIEQSLQTIAAGGQLQVLASRGYTTVLDLVDSGLLQLGGGTFHANSVTIGAASRLAGFGTISDPPVNNGVMEAQGGLMDITGNVTGSGTLQIDNLATLELGGSAAETANFAAGAVGTLKLDTAASFTGSITNVALGDVIDLVNVTPASITSLQWKTNFPRLTLLNNSTTIVSYASVTGTVPNIDTIDHWAISSDGGTGTKLTLTAGASTAVITGGITGTGGTSGGINNGTGQGNDPTWIGGSGNNFDTAANWAPAVVPTSTADAVIGNGFSVLSNSGTDAVNTLSVGTGSTLTVAGPGNGAFKVILGTDPAGIAGTIAVSDFNSLDLGGSITLSGSIVLGSTGDNTNLVFTQPINSLRGGGKVVLGNSVANRIYGQNGNFTLSNINDTISGAGQLGSAQMIFSNAGTVLANQSNPLMLNTSPNLVVNTGTMEDTGTGGLQIVSTAVVNTGGSIFAAGAGSHVDLVGGSIQGGTVSGLIEGLSNVNNTNSLDGVTSGPLTNNGTVVVNDLTQLWLLGTINNGGTILEGQSSTNGNTAIRLNSPVVTLQGGGQVMMTNDGGNQIFGQSAFDTLVNVNNTISGAGQLGSAQMTLVNETNGVILANQSPTFIQTGQLTIDTAGNPTSVVVNAGILEATAAGGLLIRDTTVNNTGGTLGSIGTVEAVGAAAVVDLAGATIHGGVLATSGGGVIQTIIESNFTVSGTLDGFSTTAVNNTGTVLVNDQTILSLLGAINNTGTIVVDQVSTGGGTSIRLDSQFVTLEGAGQVQLSNNAGSAIFGHFAVDTLINANNTISGAGQLGASQMTFVNQAAGIVDANQPTDLLLNTNGNVTTNGGLLEATNGGTLIIQNTTVNNQGGTILSSGAGSVVGLQSPNAATTIAGGLVIGDDPVQAQDRGGTLDGQSDGMLTIQGTVEINNTDALSLIGTINNTGTILEAGGGRAGNTDLIINSQIVTLTGGGTVLMANNSAGNGNDRIFAGGNGLLLVNVNNTIAGAGQFTVTSNVLNVTNEAAGIIDANLLAPLVIADNGNGEVTNQGTMEATSTAALNGGLVLLNTVVDNAGGTIQAVGSAGTLALAHVDLNGADVQGGTLADTGGGVIQTVVGSTSVLDGFSLGAVKLTSGSNFVVTNDSRLELAGTINNLGTLLQSASSPTSGVDTTTVQIVVGPGQPIGTVTMTGAGQWIMTDNPNNVLNGNSGVLVNQGNTISGAGQFGDGNMSFTNTTGTLLANGVNSLVLSLGAFGFSTNNATMSATGAGGMVLAGGFFTNNGVMAANDGSSITFQSGAVNTNLAEGVLLGGTWKAIAAGHGATLSMTGGPINVDDAVLVLSGVGSVIQAGTATGTPPQYATVEQTLSSIVSGGQLQLLGNRGFVGVQGLDNSGIIQLAGGAFHAASLTVEASGVITGFGSVNIGFFNSGTVIANGGTLTIPNNIRGAGTLQTNGGATLSLSAGADQAGTVLNNGALVLTSTANLAVSGGFSGSGSVTDGGVLSIAAGKNLIDTGAITVGGTLLLAGGALHGGSLTVASGGVLSGFGTVNDPVPNSGRIEANGGTLAVAGIVTGTGTLQADSGATLALNAASAGNTASTVVDNGTLIVNASGSSLTVSGNATGSGTLDTIAGATITLNGASNTAGAVVDNGVLNLGTNAALTVSGNLSGTGAVATGSGAVLTLNGASNTTMTVTDNGTISLGTNDNLTVTGTATVNGRVQLHGGTFQATPLALVSSSVLFGFGTVSDAAANPGLIEANGGALGVNGAVTGTGTLQADSGATLVLIGASNAASTVTANGGVNIGSNTLTVSGTVAVGGAGSVQIGGGTLQAGSLTIASGGVLLGSGHVNDAAANSGRVEASGGTLTVTGAITGTGTLQADSAASLTLNGTSNTAASVLDNGTINIGASDSLDVTGSVNPSSTGLFVLTNSSLLEVAADTGGSNQMSFLGASGDKLLIDAVSSFGSNVGTTSYTGPLLETFASVDAIDLKNLIFNSGTNVATIDSYTAGTGLLQLHSGTTTATLAFQNSTLGSGSFHIAADSGTGTLITHS